MDCRSRQSVWADWVTEDSLCAVSGFRGEGTCSGDSGGPLTYNGELVGVVSWGDGPCSETRPDVFTRVFNYLDWIENIITQEN